MAELAQMSWVEVTGYVASMLVFCTFYMKTMIPLRVVGIVGNLAFMTYAVGSRLYPVLILHAVLLPLNCVRLVQMQTLIRKVREAAKGDHSMEWLIPYMQSRTLKKGVLFRKGDAAKEMYIVLSGSVRLVDVGVTVHPGAVIGEIGIFAPSGQRMDTAICESDVELASISNDRVWQLYHQNPKFGFYLIKLVIDRLLQNFSKQQIAVGNRSRHAVDGSPRTCNFRSPEVRSRRHRRGSPSRADR